MKNNIVSAAATKKFWSKVSIGSPTECWLWHGPISKDKGFGAFQCNGKRWRVHQLAYFLSTGDILKFPYGHTCKVKLCCNPAHIKPGSPTTIDYSGQKFQKLIFTIPTSKRGADGSIYWHADCECGKKCIAIPAQVKMGKVKSCGCSREEVYQSVAWRAAIYQRKNDPMISTAREVWRRTYNDGDIDFDAFFALSQRNCHYCNRPPYTTYNVGARATRASTNQIDNGNFTYNGLDRIDNSKGHTLDNVVPCCQECNLAKRAMKYDEFITLIKMIYAHLCTK